MRLLVIAGALVAIGVTAAPASGCPIDADRWEAQRYWPSPTVLVYAQAGGPWRIAGDSGLIGNGSARYDIPLLERPVLGLRYAIVDIDAVGGDQQLRLRSGARRWSGLPVDIGEPVRSVAVEDRPMRPAPDLIEPAAPDWRTPLLTGGVIGVLALAALIVRRRRGPHAAVVP